ncbi:MAG: SRPBCC family protein [Deltaproteobacteria bacterium]|nr:SRPBCC family protein [Deltaproteobacteria bacterium]
MIETRAEIEVASAVHRAWAVVWDIARYPEFLSDVVHVRVDPADDPLELEAEFEMRVFRTRRFRLRLVGEPPHRVRWTLVEGQHLRANQGEWTLALAGGDRAQMTYRLELDTSVPVPDAISRRLIDFNLPTALRQFKARIETQGAPADPPLRAPQPQQSDVHDHG